MIQEQYFKTEDWIINYNFFIFYYHKYNYYRLSNEWI
jgi:hypothetical protein